MAIIKPEGYEHYTKYPEEFSRNCELTLKEKGMLVQLLSLPPKWDFSITGLCKIVKDGRSSVTAVLKSLKEKGLIAIHQRRTPDGRFGETDLSIFLHPINAPPDRHMAEEPLSEKRDTALRTADEPETDSPLPVYPKAVERSEYRINQERVKRFKTNGYKQPAIGKARKNSFHNFPQRDYDFDQLEKELLRAQAMQDSCAETKQPEETL